MPKHGSTPVSGEASRILAIRRERLVELREVRVEVTRVDEPNTAWRRVSSYSKKVML